MQASDAAVMAMRGAGERDEFRALVERHSRGVFRLAWRMTGNEQDAEDIVQETFLRAYRAFDRFEERSQVSTWLHRIAVNCALDFLRARQREQEQRYQPAMSGDDAPPDPLASVASNEPAPDRLLMSAEMHERLSAAMNRLSATERAVFVMRHYEGQGIEEISQALQMSANATKNAIFRAVQKLRAAVEPWLGR